MTHARPCPVCGRTDAVPLLRVEAAPVFCNQLCPTREAARAAPRAPIDLAGCAGCGHVFNARFQPDLVAYSPTYDNSLHFSNRFQQYARQLAEGLVSGYGLAGRTVLEVGCGRGDFLELLTDLGVAHAHGSDPAAVERDERRSGGRLTVARSADAATSLLGSTPALVCARQVLEHVADPVAFLRHLSDLGASHLFVEVPNALYTLRDAGIWDLIYEHPSYFTDASLRRACREAGLAVDRTEETFAGQFLTVHARRTDAAPSAFAEPAPSPSPTPAPPLASFAQTYRDKVASWASRVAGWRGRGLEVAVWGAGSKGTSFLNTVPGADGIRRVVDINPRKQGMHVAGTGQPIVPPEDLQNRPADLIVVMNPVYRDEIARALEALGRPAELVCA